MYPQCSPQLWIAGTIPPGMRSWGCGLRLVKKCVAQVRSALLYTLRRLLGWRAAEPADTYEANVPAQRPSTEATPRV
jgi:hypothetical protein